MFHIYIEPLRYMTYAVMNSKADWWITPTRLVEQAGVLTDGGDVPAVPLLSQLRDQWDHRFPNDQLEALAEEFRTIARCVESPDTELCESFADMIDAARADRRVSVWWDGEP